MNLYIFYIDDVNHFYMLYVSYKYILLLQYIVFYYMLLIIITCMYIIYK